MFIKKGNHYHPHYFFKQVDSLPNSTFLMMKNGEDFYLQEITPFSIPTKLYGGFEQMADRVKETFSRKDTSVGALFTGYKGMGKTILAKLVCHKASMPTILISEPFSGASLQGFLDVITQECIVLIDEAEKVYKDKQEELLPLLDGVIKTKKLFLLTSNDKDLNSFLMNRPGRLHYHFHFDSLTEDVITEVVEDKLENEDKKEELIEFALDLGHISMDGLLALIFEINSYNQSPMEAVRHLNINVEQALYDVTMIVGGKHYVTTFTGHPYQSPKYMIYYQEGNDYWSRNSYEVVLKDAARFRGGGGDVELRFDDGTLIKFKKVKTERTQLLN